MKKTTGEPLVRYYIAQIQPFEFRTKEAAVEATRKRADFIVVRQTSYVEDVTPQTVERPTRRTLDDVPKTPGLRVLRPSKVCEKLGIGRTALSDRVRNPERFGGFPQPISLGAKAIGFLQHEIDAWVSGLERKK